MKYLYIVLLIAFGFLDFFSLLFAVSSFTHGYYRLFIVFLLVCYFSNCSLCLFYSHFDDFMKKGEMFK